VSLAQDGPGCNGRENQDEKTQIEEEETEDDDKDERLLDVIAALVSSVPATTNDGTSSRPSTAQPASARRQTPRPWSCRFATCALDTDDPWIHGMTRTLGIYNCLERIYPAV